jgi:hypothetical protein
MEAWAWVAIAVLVALGAREALHTGPEERPAPDPERAAARERRALADARDWAGAIRVLARSAGPGTWGASLARETLVATARVAGRIEAAQIATAARLGIRAARADRLTGTDRIP